MRRLRTSVLATVVFFLFVHAVSAQPAVVEKIRREYPTPLADKHGKFLVEVACVTGKGLLKKDWGTFVRVADGTGVAQDIVMDRDGTHYDILGDGEGAAVARWDQVTNPPKVDPARYYAPTCNNSPPSPAPGPEPVLDLKELSELARQILEGLVMLETRLNAVDSRARAIQTDVLELRQRPFPEYSGRIGGAVPMTLRPVK